MPPGKDELRAGFTASRRSRSAEDRDVARAAVRSVVLEQCRRAGWARVAAYVPLGTEPGSVELLDGLVSLAVHVIVPVTLADHDLDWTSWPTSTTSLGLDAIAAADAVLVPALAVSSSGVRLGRGGGSYDRALLRRAPRAIVAALLFDGETVASLPADPWDVPVTAVASPTGWTAVGRNTGVGPVG